MQIDDGLQDEGQLRPAGSTSYLQSHLPAISSRPTTPLKQRNPHRNKHRSVIQSNLNQVKMASFLLRTVFQLMCLAILMPPPCLPTSNINSVWLSGDATAGVEKPSESLPGRQVDKRSSLLASDDNKYQQRANDNPNRQYPNNASLPEVKVKEPPEGHLSTSRTQEVEKQQQQPVQLLQASSSSLQPSIAVLDTQSDRRSDVDTINLDEPQTSADQPPYSSSNQAQSNAQVQFDEVPSSVGGLKSQAAKTSLADEANKRRDNQNRNTTFQNELVPISVPSVSGLDEDVSQTSKPMDRPDVAPLTAIVGSLEDYNNNRHDYHSAGRTSQSSYNSNVDDGDAKMPTNSSRPLSSPFYYYLPERSQTGDNRWNPSGSLGGEPALSDPMDERNLASLQPSNEPKLRSGPRRSVHNSGTQYDLREPQVFGGARSHMASVHQVQAGSNALADGGSSFGALDRSNEPSDSSEPIKRQKHRRIVADLNIGQPKPAPMQPAAPSDELNQGAQYYLNRQAVEVPSIGLSDGRLGANSDHSPTTRYQQGHLLLRTTPAPMALTSGSQYLIGNSLMSYPLASPALTGPQLVRHPSVQRSTSNFQLRPAPLYNGANLVRGLSDLSPVERPDLAGANRKLVGVQQRKLIGRSRASALEDPSRAGPGVFGYIRLQPASSRPVSNGGGGSAKKSLLGALSNRLNHWVDASRSQNALESFFYENPLPRDHRELQQQLSPSAIRRLRASQAAASAHWNAANFYQAIQDTSRPVSLASVLPIGHTPDSAGYLSAERPASHQFSAAHPSLATTGFLRSGGGGSRGTLYGTIGNTGGDQYSLIRAPSGYYPSFGGQGGHLASLRSIAVHQPTVAPAPSLLERFYGTGLYPTAFAAGQQQQHRRRQRPIAFPSVLGDTHGGQLATLGHNRQSTKKATGVESGLTSASQPGDFIPVVAVSVTKTSPTPKSAAPKLYQKQQQQQQSEASDSANYIDQYLSMKQLQASQSLGQEQNRADDYGNQASGSVSLPEAPRPQTGSERHRQPATESPPAEQTTTVKSAVFGYLPNHQMGAAANPLLRAISILPQYAPPPSTSSASGHHYAGHVASASDAYANQEPPLMMSGEDTAALNGAAGEQVLLAPSQPAMDEPPSLALQLQANSFAQNDIAHPFFEPASAYGQPHRTFQAGSALGNGFAAYLDRGSQLELYPTAHDGHQYQLLKPTDQQATSYLNPLLAGAEAGLQSLRSAHLVAAASDMNQHLLPVVFANPDSVRQFQQVTLDTLGPQRSQPSRGPNGEQVPDESASSPSHASVDSQVATAAAAAAGTLATSSNAASSVLNKGNKKRSSEFFASAGQLLLSALPLLLAPTLGLMFASSPNPVARYHTPGSSAAFSSGAGNAITGSYINSLNSGLVSNASPAPKLFTPTPPNYHLMLAGTGTPSTARPASRTSTTRMPSVSGSENAITKNRTTIVVQKSSAPIELTTLGPPPLGMVDSNSSLTAGTSDQHLLNQTTTISGATIHLLSEDEQQDGAMEAGTDLTKLKSHHYEIGIYEDGADFDTQIADLKKKQNQKKQQQQQIAINNLKPADHSYLDAAQNLLNIVQAANVSKSTNLRNKNRLYYSEVVTSPGILTGQRPNMKHNRVGSSSNISKLATNSSSSSFAGNDADDEEDTDEVSTKLYPVSTRPSARRKVVSVVTSNGNKTLPDASDKYNGLGALGGSSTHLIPASSNVKYNTPDFRKSATSRVNSSANNFERNYHLLNDGLPMLRNHSSANLTGRHAGPMEFLISDGAGHFATVSLADEQEFERQPVIMRSKRDVKETSADLAFAASSNSIGDVPFTFQKKVKLLKKPKKSPNPIRIKHSGSQLEPPMAVSSTGNTSNHVEQSSAIDYQTVSNPQEDHSTTSVNEPVQNQNEPLRGEATKSKSAHIITTMIQQVDNSNEPDEERAKPDEVSADDYQQGESGSNLDGNNNEVLREQLIGKKVILEKMAKKHPRSNSQRDHLYRQQHNQPSTADNQQQVGAGELANFSAGGRGRFQPTPMQQPVVQTHSMKVRLYANGSTSAEQAPSRVARPPKDSRRNLANHHLALADDTKKALVNLSSLLMKDTLQREFDVDPELPSPNRPRKDTRHRSSSGDTDGVARRRPHYAPSARLPPPISDDRYEYYEGSATERSVSITTSSPASINYGEDPSYQSNGSADLWPRDPPSPPVYYSKITTSNGRYPSHQTGNSSAESDYATTMQSNKHNMNLQPPPTMGEFAALSGARDRVNLLEPEPAPYGINDDRPTSEVFSRGGGGEEGFGAYASQDGRYSGSSNNLSPIGQYMYAMNHSNGLNRSSSIEGEPIQYQAGYSNHSDRRAEAHGPYSRPPEPYLGAYSNAHYSEPSRRPVQAQVHQQQRPYSYEPATRYPPGRETHYAIGGPDPSQHYNGTTYAPIYHNHKPASSPHYNHQAAQVNYNHDQEYPSNANAYSHHPSPVYGAHQHHHPPPPPPPSLHPLPPPSLPPPPPVHQSHYGKYTPAESRYPIRPLEYGAPQREYHPPTMYNRNTHYQIDSSPYGAPSASAQPYQGTSVAPFGEKSDSRAVNEYLKRVQFTDSDRDKLMASYLTCDGLLNDNDHCLERLSCEFSDPQNIEKANKLDRAVSSILLGHILINTYIPNQFKLRLKAASVFGFTNTGKCSRFPCHKLAKSSN